MNNEYHDDLRKAKLYLTLAPDELENVKAEHAKWERRKAAMRYADTGSPQPISFAPITCQDCAIILTRMNHGSGLRCERCFRDLCDEAEAKQRGSLSANASRPLHWLTVCALVVLAGLAAWGLGDLVAQLAWSAGK